MSNIILWFTMMTTMCLKYPVNIQQCLTPWTWFPPYVTGASEPARLLAVPDTDFKQDGPDPREADRLRDAAKAINLNESLP